MEVDAAYVIIAIARDGVSATLVGEDGVTYR